METPTPTPDQYCILFPSDPSCIDPSWTPTPTASPTAYFTPTPTIDVQYIDIASDSAFAQGMHNFMMNQYIFMGLLLFFFAWLLVSFYIRSTT